MVTCSCQHLTLASISNSAWTFDPCLIIQGEPIGLQPMGGTVPDNFEH
jgi:hypothetical protein